MPLNTHYSGRLNTAINRTLEKSYGRDGKFYEIFNKYGFYDVNDENNGLTKEQIAQVPVINQTRFTQFSNAIAEMIRFVLADSNYGILTKDMQNIIDKLDIRSSSNNAQLNAIGTGLASTAGTLLAPLALIDASRRIADAQSTMAMGSNPFNADLIPPIAIGLDGLPVSIANTFKNGFFQPNWDFLYRLEPIKSNKFYETGDGKIRIGCNIILDQGGDKKELILKNIFSVNTTDKNLTPIGDTKGGLSVEQYEIIKSASNDDSFIVLDSDSKYGNFRLNEAQIQSSFFKYVQIRLWNAITNRRNWSHSHWGALTHNSCPEYLKSAICSYLWTNGLAIEPDKSDESAYISYCLTIGMYYLTGYQYKIVMNPIDGVDRIISNSGENVSVNDAELDTDYEISDIDSNNIIALHGVPRDREIAEIYFTWIADILTRLTNSTNGNTIDIQTRKRRIAEANLIYRGLGYPTISYGDNVKKLNIFHQTSELRIRKFDKIMNSTIIRYANEGVAGGMGANNSLVEPELNSVKINYDSTARQDIMTELSLNVIRNICTDAGVREINITSTYRPPEIQVRAMFNNLQNNKRVNYAPPGRNVVKVYDDHKKRYGIPFGQAITDSIQIEETKQAMIMAVENGPPERISKHCVNPVVVQAVDISPTRMVPANKISTFRLVAIQYEQQGILKAFLGPKPEGPGSDPAFHIEIWQDNRAPDGFSDQAVVNNALPDVLFRLNNTNLTMPSNWINPLIKDHIDYKNDLDDIDEQI